MKPHALSTRRRWLAVLGGGFLGAITRYLLSAAIQARLGNAWPYDILLINLTGAFVLALVTVLADATTLVGPTRRLFINVGFLGAYTTFSSLALGDVLLLGKARWLAAALYLVLSLAGGLALALLGETAGRWLQSRLVRQHRRASGAVRPFLASGQVEAAALVRSGETSEARLADDPDARKIKRSL